MTSRPMKIAAAVAAATALAGTAYALGSESNGAADAAGTTGSSKGARWAFHRAGRDAGIDALASKLGVSADELRTALQGLRPAEKPRDDFAAAIAKALGIDEAKVTAAFDKLRDDFRRGRPGRLGFDRRGPRAFESALAKELGVSAAKLRDAFQNAASAAREAHLDEEAGELAGALGVDKAKVKAALEKIAPKPGTRPRFGRGPVDFAAQLADELGLKTSDVTAAFDKLRQRRQDEFAQKLADKLGISVDKVKSALADSGPPWFGFGHGPRQP